MPRRVKLCHTDAICVPAAPLLTPLPADELGKAAGDGASTGLLPLAWVPDCGFLPGPAQLLWPYGETHTVSPSLSLTPPFK